MKKYRVKQSDVESSIKKVEYVKLGTKMTAAVVTMQNGHEVIGLAGCVDADQYNLEIGGPIALSKAKDKIWALLGYAKQCEMYEDEEAESKADGTDF